MAGGKLGATMTEIGCTKPVLAAARGTTLIGDPLSTDTYEVGMVEKSAQGAVVLQHFGCVRDPTTQEIAHRSMTGVGQNIC